MIIIKNILLSGWFQLILLALMFMIYSRRVLLRQLIKGYALGWMLGLFFIFSYTAVSRPQAFFIGTYNYNLSIVQVLLVSVLAMFMSIGMSVMAYTFRDSQRWQSLQAAAITAIFVIVIFLQLIATPSIGLMASLFVLAYGMTTLFASIFISRRYETDALAENAPYAGYGDEENIPTGASRLDTIRQRIVQRINRNNVPTNYHDQYS